MPKSQYKTVNISPASHKKLRVHASVLGVGMGVVLEELIMCHIPTYRVRNKDTRKKGEAQK